MVNKRTLLYHIMQNTVNGDEIVIKKLDEYIKTPVSQGMVDENTVEIELSSLEPDIKNCNIVKDILRIKHDASNNVLLHPVIETYIDLKWRRAKKYVTVHFCIYLAFLLVYSWFLANIFYRPLHQYIEIDLSQTDGTSFPSLSLQSSNDHMISHHFDLGENNESSLFTDGRNSRTQGYHNFILRLGHQVANKKLEVQKIDPR